MNNTSNFATCFGELCFLCVQIYNIWANKCDRLTWSSGKQPQLSSIVLNKLYIYKCFFSHLCGQHCGSYQREYLHQINFHALHKEQSHWQNITQCQKCTTKMGNFQLAFLTQNSQSIPIGMNAFCL